MHFPTLLISLALSTAAAAKGQGQTKVLSTEDQCREQFALQKFVAFASNTTQVSMVTKGNATKTADLEAKASAAQSQLTALQSNSTLQSSCEIIDAQLKTEDQCQQTFVLQRFVAFAANTSLVASATSNNATKIANIELKASDAANKLQELTSNSTLQAQCPAVMQKDECSAMKGLEKFVSLANNQTKLDAITKGNTTKEAEIKASAAKAQTQLDAMTGNATFVAACDALNASDSEFEI